MAVRVGTSRQRSRRRQRPPDADGGPASRRRRQVRSGLRHVGVPITACAPGGRYGERRQEVVQRLEVPDVAYQVQVGVTF